MTMSMSQILQEVARKHPSAIALKQGTRVLTYVDLIREASTLGAALRRMGLKPGERIVLLGFPSLDIVISYYAAIAIGAVPVSVFASLAPREIQQTVEDAAPSAVIFDAASAVVAAGLRYENRPIEIACDPDDASHITLAGLTARETPLAQWHEPDPDDLAIIVYTGGSTGRPKGVMHTHRSIYSWVNMDTETFGVGHAPQHKAILFNMSHLSGQTYLWMMMIMGGSVTLLDRYPAQVPDIVDLIERERITGLATVSGVLSGIVNMPGIEQRDLRSLRIVGVGGSFTSSATLKRAVELLPWAHVLVTYSQTESGQVVSTLSVNHALKTKQEERLLSVGAPAAMFRFGQQPLDVRIVDDAGNDVPRGEIGEIVLRGVQTMRGYWNNVDGTNEVQKDGWLYTGDIGRMDQDGYLYLLDRMRDMIIAGNGVNVYSAEVEHAVSLHPAVAECAVIGVPRRDREDIAAVVCLRQGTQQQLTLEELRTWCQAHVGAYKLPTMLRVVDALPRTDAGKTSKVALREMFGATLASKPV